MSRSPRATALAASTPDQNLEPAPSREPGNGTLTMAAQGMKTIAILGRKIGMTRYFDEHDANIPVTVLQCGPCPITQIKTTETDQYSAIQLGYEDVDPRHSTIPVIGHDARAGVTPKRFHRELRFESDEDAANYEIGREVTVEDFEDVYYVDISATSKGKGFQGVMKRHNFQGQGASHGVKRKHRAPGSINGHATNLGTGPKPKKGKRMAGQMGNEQVTSRNHEIVKILPEKNLLLVKGAVPGPDTGLVFVRSSRRLGRRKQLRLQEKVKAG